MKKSFKSTFAKPLSPWENAVFEIMVICTVVPLVLCAAVKFLVQ